VFTSHDINNSFRIANRLIIIDERRIAAIGTPQQLKGSDNPFVRQFLQAAMTVSGEVYGK